MPTFNERVDIKAGVTVKMAGRGWDDGLVIEKWNSRDRFQFSFDRPPDGGPGTLLLGYNSSSDIMSFYADDGTGRGKVGIGTKEPAERLDVAGAAHASSFPTSSDARFKTNVTQVKNVLEKLEGLRPVSFEWNELYESLGRSTGRREIGLIAQEVEAAFPELVSTWGEEGYKAVDYGRLTAVLIEAVRELRAENEALKQRTEALERATVEKETLATSPTG